ncbi:NAD(P)H-dependent flavin oxidoreductase [Salimicrobium halophilum]|uniref:Probable nitronate monooxygenase n=1 Tax=Salimicrobium halophilum TaxID=86666 RepID=A0A1G8QI46_9BACI|nr:nitronate monooxygenase [Salimicrobium halophilum]SDJ04397.1 2-nitropropane dioxygenase precursor [Salimicrobium halophilum]
MNWNTRVTELLSIKYPIIQGGLAHLAYSDLAAAVSNAGGLGQITAMSLATPEELRTEIHKTKEKTSLPFGVNYAIGNHGRPYEEMVQVAIEEKVPVISVTGGNPKGILEMVEGTGIKKLVLVAAKRQAQKAEELGADAVMVVGQEGGGHIGRADTGTFVLTPEVSDAVDIPVIASGGVSDGRGLMAALALGAEGVEMGTRFVATKECVHAHDLYKEAILHAGITGTTVIKRSIGAPARVLLNDWVTHILSLEEKEVGYDGLKTYISGDANKRFIHEGIENEGFGWAGQVSGRIDKVVSVNELFVTMIKDAEKIRGSWG